MQPRQEYYPHTFYCRCGSMKDVVTDIRHPTIYMLHLPVSPDDTLHFYRYLCTHVLITSKQFFTTDWSYPFRMGCDKSPFISFHPEHPTQKFSACYYINTKYLGITKDENHGSGTFHHPDSSLPSSKWTILGSITTPFEPLANPPSCISDLYVKNLSRYYLMMLIANMENFRCKPTNHRYCQMSGFLLHHSLLPAGTIMLICSWKDYSIHYYKKTCTYFEDTYDLQHAT